MDKLKERLDMFSDAVIAIIITIMILELPVPHDDSWTQYLQLGKGIGIFLISFCFIANIWYQHSMLYSETKTINNSIFVIEFIFLAFLSLTPTFTKMITEDTNRHTVMAYGILILIVNGLFMLLSYEIAKQKHGNASEIKKVFLKIYFDHSNTLGLANIALLILAYFQPTWALWCYLALPVISFIFNRNDYSDLEKITQLPEEDQEKYVNFSSADEREFRKMQREIGQKYAKQRTTNPNWRADMTDEMRELFQQNGISVRQLRQNRRQFLHQQNGDSNNQR